MLARILNNWPYKLLALAIAIVLRFYVGSATNPQETKSITVPIIVSGVPDSLVATDSTPNVMITYSGEPTVIDSLSPSDIAATVNVARAHAGINPALAIDVTEPPDIRDQVTIVSKRPSGASVYLDSKASIVMSVRAEFPQNTPVGYEYELPAVDPATARVEGAESLLKTVSRLVVFTDTDSDTLASPTTIDYTGEIVAVDSRNAIVNGVTVTPAQAHVDIPVHKVGALKSLVISPQVEGAPRYPYRVWQVDVDPAMVTVSGPAPLLAQTSVALTLPIDIADQTDTVRKAIKLDLPAGLTAVQNPTVEVTVHMTSEPPGTAVPTGLSPRDTRYNAIQ